MKYMGSKARIAKEVISVIEPYRFSKEQVWVEPFVGGCNMIDKVQGKRIAADNNEYLIAMWQAVQKGWLPHQRYSKEEYDYIRKFPESVDKATYGYVGIACSYSGKWWGGYAGMTTTKEGVRDYQAEAFNNLLKQSCNLYGIEFICSDYSTLKIPSHSIIYCDPPYANTTKYRNEFNHSQFFDWCTLKAKEGHLVFLSEYEAPKPFTCIWQKELKSSLSANGKIGSSKNSVEKLFILGT